MKAAMRCFTLLGGLLMISSLALAQDVQLVSASAKPAADSRIVTLQYSADKSGQGIFTINLPKGATSPLLQEKDRELDITIPHAELAANWVSTMDVQEFKTSVSRIVGVNHKQDAQLILLMNEPFHADTKQTGSNFTVMIQSAQKALMEQQGSGYFGKKISLNFQNISVRSVIQVIADFTGINIVTSDSVQGNISIRLKDVPWDQALDIILKSRGLSQRRIGNVIYIGPAVEVAAQEREALDEQKQANAVSKLQEEYFHLGYADASQIAGVLQANKNGFLSDRGSATVDARTNTVLVQDTCAQLDHIRRLIATLDVPVQQVLIEARVVVVDKKALENFGVTSLPAMAPGTAPFSGSGSSSGQSFTPAATTGNQSGQPVNAGASGFINNGLEDASGALGLSLSGLPGGFNLNLELQALETEGEGKVISSPSLTVADKQEAYIQQGTEIPYQASTSSGASVTQFQNAVLSLRVTPQITPDGNIVLVLNVSNDAASDQTVDNVPIINTSEIKTQVLVKNGQTIVLGGIQVQTRHHLVRKIPFLGDLPGIGYLFKSTSDLNRVQQLLIFLTPKIIHQKLGVQA